MGQLRALIHVVGNEIEHRLAKEVGQLRAQVKGKYHQPSAAHTRRVRMCKDSHQVVQHADRRAMITALNIGAAAHIVRQECWSGVKQRSCMDHIR